MIPKIHLLKTKVQRPIFTSLLVAAAASSFLVRDARDQGHVPAAAAVVAVDAPAAVVAALPLAALAVVAADAPTAVECDSGNQTPKSRSQ